MSTKAKETQIITDSKSLFRNLLNAAIAANLRQNEFKVFSFLLGKTLGYGKRSDRLTTGVIAKSSGIRKDHAKKAIKGLLASGIFDRKKSKQYEYRYTIGTKFLDHFDGIFFAPAFPKFGNSLPNMEGLPESWEHTDKYLNNSLSLPIQQRPSPTLVIDLNLSGHNNLSKERRCGRQVDNQRIQQELLRGATPIPNQHLVPININQSQWSWKESGLKLPTSIDKTNHNFCINILKKGEIEQAKDTLAVYNDLQNKGLVRNPPLLLRKLSELSIIGELAAPQAIPNVPNKVFLPLVPNGLDDGLTEYARKHGYSEAPNVAGFGYVEYRSMLRKEREKRLAEMEKQALEEIKDTQVKPTSIELTHDDESITSPEVDPYALFNEILDRAGKTGETVQEIALETGQIYVLEAMGMSTDIPTEMPQITEPVVADDTTFTNMMAAFDELDAIEESKR